MRVVTFPTIKWNEFPRGCPGPTWIHDEYWIGSSLALQPTWHALCTTKCPWEKYGVVDSRGTVTFVLLLVAYLIDMSSYQLMYKRSCSSLKIISIKNITSLYSLPNCNLCRPSHWSMISSIVKVVHHSLSVPRQLIGHRYVDTSGGKLVSRLNRDIL